MTIPTFNLPDGTTRQYLAATHEAAADAVRDALGVVRATIPSSRDYPDDGAFTNAFAAHLDRMERIRSVLRELDALVEDFEEEGGAR